MHVLSLAGCLYLECHDLLFNLGWKTRRMYLKRKVSVILMMLTLLTTTMSVIDTGG